MPKTPWKFAATTEKNDTDQESKLKFETACENGMNASLRFGDANLKMGPVGGMDL